MIKVYKFPSISEEIRQGSLRVFELNKMPFICKRVFSVVNAQAGSIRGEHAHKICNQLICCVSGKVLLTCNNGIETIQKELTPSSEAVLVPAGVWAKQTYLQDNSVILVFCDQLYDEADYIRNYNNFLRWKELNK